MNLVNRSLTVRMKYQTHDELIAKIFQRLKTHKVAQSFLTTLLIPLKFNRWNTEQNHEITITAGKSFLIQNKVGNPKIRNN
jgi:hypothetical protein